MGDSVYDTMPERDAADIEEFLDDAERLLVKHGYYEAAAGCQEAQRFIAGQEREIERLRRGIANYIDEFDGPAPDYTMKAAHRAQLRRLIGRAARGGEGE